MKKDQRLKVFDDDATHGIQLLLWTLSIAEAF
jgi:hypothetical protein